MIDMRFEHVQRADLNLLLAGLLLLEEQSVSRAADRYLLSQPAMSRTLQRLRATFNDELLVRTPSGFEPTLRGRQVLVQLESILPQVNRLLAPVEFTPATTEETYRIAATDYAVAVFAPTLLGRLARLAPGVTVELEAWTPESFGELERGRLDAALWINSVPPPLQFMPIYEEEFVCVQSVDELVQELDLERYSRRSHAVVSMRDGQQVYVDDRLGEFGVRRLVGVRVPSFTGAIAVAAETSYLATVPRRLAQMHAHDPRIRIVPAPNELGRYTYTVAWHPRTQADPAHRWLRGLIVEVGEKLQAQRAS